MREILFRGKTEKGKWVYGHYVKLYDTHCINLGENGAYYHMPICVETLDQYTGLTDKNGTKIFEGDIVKTKKGKPYEVKTHKGAWTIWNDNFKNDYERWDYLNTFNSRIEIIGNIHDNPELLGGD